MHWDPISEDIDCVFRMPISTRTLPPFQHTNSFLFGSREIGMVDAGQWDETTMEGLVDFLKGLPGRDFQRLFLTHWHPDHCVGAERVRAATGCRVGAPRQEAEKGGLSFVDFTFEDGDVFTMEGRDLEVIHTPGHSSGHCCFFLRSEGVLFTGDHILGMGTSIIVPPDGDMSLYMRSLERLLSLPLRVICPGHGPLVWDPRARIEEYTRHRREREENILDAIREGVCVPEAMVRRVYTDVPEHFHPMAFFTVLAHLAKLEKEGKARKSADGEGYEAV